MKPQSIQISRIVPPTHEKCVLPLVYKLVVLPSASRRTLENPTTYLILAGTHGTEPGPAFLLEQFVRHVMEHGYAPMRMKPGLYFMVPFVNPEAIELRERFVPGQVDINRSYPDLHPINVYMSRFIKQADFILDFHESWGFNRCSPTSLGQTVYYSHCFLHGACQQVADQLNQLAETMDISDCHSWETQPCAAFLDTLPHTLYQYTRTLNKPYVLVEMAIIVPLEQRLEETYVSINHFVRE